jgi:hypothetical protein
VFNFKVADSGVLIGAYTYNPGEGLYVNSDMQILDSRNKTWLRNLTPGTWYTAAIYNKGSAGYQAFWLAEGKGVDLWPVSRAYEYGIAPWSGSNRAVFFAYGNTERGSADWQLDNIRVNEGLDLTGVVLP